MNNITVENVAPVLRILFGDGRRYPIVRFESTGTSDTKALDISLKAGSSQKEIIEQLKKAVKDCSEPVGAVNVEGVGFFRIIRPADSGKAAGKTAIVTGAAQGFGLEIAQDLAANGACVVLADLNIEKAKHEAELLNNNRGDGRSLALSMNVTDADSIKEAIAETVKYFGGFDIFISNAGVLKAESVKTQSQKDFDFVTEVNYKGYFLCVQAAAGILALAHQVDSGYTSDIIQINSKSGLKGSRRNFAYAGSKFAGIGLTQSFALELVEDGIKVNSVCPGNFFDGPLWSDSQNGLFVQYLKANKVPGAKTVADVRKAYEAMVPMKRGCTTADVMKAVYYLIEQQYETGQAVPVTGGQIMLH